MAIKTKTELLVEELMKNYQKPEDIIGENGLLKQLTKQLLNKALDGEITHHLGYEKHSSKGNNTGNSRNGKTSKKIKGDFGEIDLEVPRDRNGDFDPQIIEKNQTHFTGFDDKIISMYSRGMTTRDIAGHLNEIYRVKVSAEFVSRVTNSVMEAVIEWQNRPLSPLYPILYLDALRINIRDDGKISKKSVYLAFGVNMEGEKEVLGLWIAQNEGAKFWLSVITDLKNRGVNDILIACVDGLKGFPEAINAVYPETEVQLCIVHMVRNSLKYVSYKNKKLLSTDLKTIYTAATAELAEQNLKKFSEKWAAQYPMISKSWKNNWINIIPFFAYPEAIRKAIYTTNAIESLNMTLRKVIKNRASFPNDNACRKILYLSLERVSKKWTMPIRDWGRAINQFAIMFGDRVQL